MLIDVDKLERRCPRLGSKVTCRYCLEHGSDTRLPCWKIIDCWWEHFDIRSYLRENFSAADMNALEDARPKPKVASLIELIEQAKKRRHT